MDDFAIQISRFLILLSKFLKRNFGKVSVISGLNEGDLVISEGVSKVRDKGKIKIITSTK